MDVNVPLELKATKFNSTESVEHGDFTWAFMALGVFHVTGRHSVVRISDALHIPWHGPEILCIFKALI